MTYIITFFILIASAWGLLKILQRKERKDQQAIMFINSYSFPPQIQKSIKIKYPSLTEEDVSLVINGLRQYFIICSIGGRKLSSMPSQAVDIGWHEFILSTKKYRNFCDTAFGWFLHHTPAEEMESSTTAQDGIKHTWNMACRIENINPNTPRKLPLLFSIDGQLNIPNGFVYKLNCDPTKREFCARSIGGSRGTESGCNGIDCGGD